MGSGSTNPNPGPGTPTRARRASGDRVRPFRPRRSLGQSFLVHNPTASSLVDALDLRPEDTVLEIGPGKGILTRRLLEASRKVIAVEIDERLVQRLEQELGGRTNLSLVRADFLSWRFPETSDLKVIGNLPYSASSPILFRLLEEIGRWQLAVLTAQREFAERVLARPGSKSLGALSVFLERVCGRERLFNIRADRFRPRPKVTSTSFRLRRRPAPLVQPSDLEQFCRVVRASFGQRRKTLANNLSRALDLDKEQVVCLLASAGIAARARAEDCGVPEFYRLSEGLERLRDAGALPDRPRESRV